MTAKRVCADSQGASDSTPLHGSAAIVLRTVLVTPALGSALARAMFAESPANRYQHSTINITIMRLRPIVSNRGI